MTAHDSGTRLGKRHLPWLWGGAFVITALFGFGLTPWDTIRVAIGDVDGVDKESLLAFAAGYALPATLGFALIVWLIYSDALHDQNGPTQVVVYALILAGSAVLCQFLGLGLIPAFSEGTYRAGPPFMTIPLFVISAYINSYGWALMVSAAAIGTAAGLHIAVHTRADDGPGTVHD